LPAWPAALQSPGCYPAHCHKMMRIKDATETRLQTYHQPSQPPEPQPTQSKKVRVVRGRTGCERSTEQIAKPQPYPRTIVQSLLIHCAVRPELEARLAVASQQLIVFIFYDGPHVLQNRSFHVGL
jgi:hypothetical protein